MLRKSIVFERNWVQIWSSTSDPLWPRHGFEDPMWTFLQNLQIAVESSSDRVERTDFTGMVLSVRSFSWCEHILVRFILILVEISKVFNCTVLNDNTFDKINETALETRSEKVKRVYLLSGSFRFNTAPIPPLKRFLAAFGSVKVRSEKQWDGRNWLRCSYCQSELPGALQSL